MELDRDSDFEGADLVRYRPMTTLVNTENLYDMVNLVRQRRPNLLIVDDWMPQSTAQFLGRDNMPRPDEAVGDLLGLIFLFQQGMSDPMPGQRTRIHLCSSSSYLGIREQQDRAATFTNVLEVHFYGNDERLSQRQARYAAIIQSAASETLRSPTPRRTAQRLIYSSDSDWDAEDNTPIVPYKHPVGADEESASEDDESYEPIPPPGAKLIPAGMEDDDDHADDLPDLN
ncbi:uncharacterized protein LOC106167187 [Lingula anatina]|uniref:Uncharacterized protein LOC106167187 n=1 Tax=Lingula anatina TaxID=7574 RepID=A0A1S3IV01_LINAN|nr:uncharacterized protein LOC106167187 [Lingula anatina]|eukprot:XP_013401369.1 uncharacterized protein LOC106167187 [Lingula anatina]